MTSLLSFRWCGCHPDPEPDLLLAMDARAAKLCLAAVGTGGGRGSEKGSGFRGRSGSAKGSFGLVFAKAIVGAGAAESRSGKSGSEILGGLERLRCGRAVAGGSANGFAFGGVGWNVKGLGPIAAKEERRRDGPEFEFERGRGSAKGFLLMGDGGRRCGCDCERCGDGRGGGKRLVLLKLSMVLVRSRRRDLRRLRAKLEARARMGGFVSPSFSPAISPPLIAVYSRSRLALMSSPWLGWTRASSASQKSCRVAFREAIWNAIRDEGPMLELSEPFLEVDSDFPSDETRVVTILSLVRRLRRQKYHARAMSAIKRRSPKVMPTASPVLEPELWPSSW